MKYSDHINIDTIYTRSINIERDTDSPEIVKSYVPTSRAVNTLYRIADTFDQDSIPRSWALIGPYGSGKSSFAVYLSHLLDDPDKEAKAYAFDILKKAEPDLFEKFQNHMNTPKGYLHILITGSPEPLLHRFIVAMRDAAVKFWNKAGRKPKIIDKINKSIDNPSVSTSEVMGLVEGLSKAVKKIGKGVLIVFDEFGKFLEYEARHYEANDIYLLQTLSELAFDRNKADLFVFTLMHQGFEEYARGLGNTLRNEWNKIQGRFEIVPFLESTEQIIHIIGKAFINDLPDKSKDIIHKKCLDIANVLAGEKALPGTLTPEKAVDLFAKCYPLHPLTAIILPVLCQKMAQNERTLFSYLGSKERFGFKNRLEKLESIRDWVMPWEVYEYFIQNQPAILTDPITQRRWAEVVTAIERLGDAPAEDIVLLKTIGLFNIIGVQAGFKASRDLVELCSENFQAMENSMENLIGKSVVQFRKFSNEYRVWQGSDFDLEFAVQDELGQIGRFDLAETIESIQPLHPVVAHRHSIEKGALRYFIPYFVDIKTYKRYKPKGGQQRLIFCMAESSDEMTIGKTEVAGYFQEYDVLAVCPNGSQLRQSVGEVLALHRVRQNCPELNTDPIAQKEFKDRLVAAEIIQEQMLGDLLESPGASFWYQNGVSLEIKTKRNLQEVLSRILNRIYISSPVIKNELINREKPSAQAAAARNKLIFAMMHHMEEKDLGIEKFPAEKGIYKAFLQATGLHRENQKGLWELIPPDKENAFNFYPVWRRIDEFLDTTTKEQKSFAELDETLVFPPYGLKAGVLPIFYLTVFLCNQKDLAFYENDVYTPYITDQHIERFMKRPDHFSVQRLEIKGLRASLFDRYAKVLFGENTKLGISLLEITRPFAKFIDDLEVYTKQTNRISDAGQNTIKAFKLAKSPADLLFSRLPKACSFPAIDPDETNTEKIEGFSDVLIKVIRELRDTYQNMLGEFLSILKKTLLPDVKQDLDLALLREKVRGRFDGLKQFTVDTKGLKAFISHLVDKTGDEDVWFDRLLLFLGSRASKKWSDIDRDNAVLRLTQYSKSLFDLRILQDHYMKNQLDLGEDFEIIRVRSMRYGKSNHEKTITIDAQKKEFFKKHKNKFTHLLEGLDDQSKVEMLADMLDEYLTKIELGKKTQDRKVSNE